MEIKKGGYGMEYRFPITQDGEPFDLTGKTPYIQIKGTNVTHRQCTIDPVDKHIAIFTVLENDFADAEPGDYNAEIEIHGSGYKEDTDSFVVTIIEPEVTP